MSDSDPNRLLQHGSELERSVLGSALEDQPSAAVRRAVTAQVVDKHRASRRRALRALAASSALVLAAAAAFALLLRRKAEPVTLAAEPRSNVSPSALSSTVQSTPTPPIAPSGASPLLPCTPSVVAAGSQPLIDDFEDGDVSVPMVEHRAGQWLTFNDGTGAQFPKPGALFSASRIPGGRGTSRFGIHSVGSKFSKWGANLSLELNPRRCYDASAYGGIEFWARGRGEIRVVVEMTQVVTEEFGGACVHDCFDAHAKRIKLGRDFQHVLVRWSDLRQAGFGTQLPFDARSLDSIQFSVQPDQTPFDFWIDDVSFSPR